MFSFPCKGWDYRAGLAEEAEKEEKIVAKARKNGVPPKRKSFIPFIGLGPLSVRFWARKHFFKLQRLRMYDESPAIEALRDPETRRAFGNNNRGFLDFVLAIDEVSINAVCFFRLGFKCFSPQHFAPALNKRALLSFDVGDYEAARKDLEVAVRFFPYFSDAVSNLGLALHELGHLEQAFRMYSIALSIEGDEISFNNRGLCLNDMGRNEEVRKRERERGHFFGVHFILLKAINDFMTILTFLGKRPTNGAFYSFICPKIVITSMGSTTWHTRKTLLVDMRKQSWIARLRSNWSRILRSRIEFERSPSSSLACSGRQLPTRRLRANCLAVLFMPKRFIPEDWRCWDWQKEQTLPPMRRRS